MVRRPLHRILSNRGAHLARSRELARTAAEGATDVLHPLITIARGLRRLASAGRRRWLDTPKDRRGAPLLLTAAVILAVMLLPYGPLLATVTLMATAAWQGRDRAPATPDGPDASQAQRLQSLHDALVPYFSSAGAPHPLYTHGGTWEKAFPAYEFDATGRITHLVVAYPAYYTDGEAEARARIEHLLATKSGRGREYHFTWDEEGNELTVRVLAPLPTDIAAQRFVASPGETVLGFTDPTQVHRTLPVTLGEERRDVPPVVWRSGIRSTEPHLLAAGRPGSGTTTLLRSVSLQALLHGDVLIVDGGGTGEYSFLTGRDGVLAVECGLTGALESLRWAAHETERRLVAANRAHQAGSPPPEDTRRPLWILLDRPSTFTRLAAADGQEDPQSLLQVPLWHGRQTNVTVVVADQLDGLETLDPAVRRHTHARVVLGPATPEQVKAVLGAPPHTTPLDHVPAGRGYARLGTGPVHRLQVPATPNPYDDATGGGHRQAVLELLSARSDRDHTRTEAEHPTPPRDPAEPRRPGGENPAVAPLPRAAARSAEASQDHAAESPTAPGPVVSPGERSMARRPLDLTTKETCAADTAGAPLAPVPADAAPTESSSSP